MKPEDIASNRFVLDVKAAQDLRTKLQKDPQAGIKDAAKQFEGMFMQMVMKSMRDATPSDGIFNSDATRFYQTILDQQMAQQKGATGQIGFAKLIEQQLGRNLANDSGKSDAAISSLEVSQQALQARQASQYTGTGAERIRSAPAASIESADRHRAGPLPRL